MKSLTKLTFCLLVLFTLAGCEYTVIETPARPCRPHHKYAWQDHGRHVIAFTSDSCGRCRADKPELRRLQNQGVDVVEIDVDDNPDLVAEYNVEKTPTYLAMEDGVVKARSISIGVIIAFLKVAAWLILTFL